MDDLPVQVGPSYRAPRVPSEASNWARKSAEKQEAEARAWYSDLSSADLEAEREYLERLIGTLRRRFPRGVPPEYLERLFLRDLRFVEAEIKRRETLVMPVHFARTRVTAEFAQELKRRVPLHEFIVYRHPSIALKSAGRGAYKACCPFHVEKTPSFTVYPDHWYCFGCGVGGDIYSFIQRLGFTWREAVTLVAVYAGVSLPTPTPYRPPEGTKTASPTGLVGTPLLELRD